jgi:hypothetical protein
MLDRRQGIDLLLVPQAPSPAINSYNGRLDRFLCSPHSEDYAGKRAAD